MSAADLKSWKRRALRAEKELEMYRRQREHDIGHERERIHRHVSHSIAIDEIRETLATLDRMMHGID